jgi:hypothetical protein
LLRDFPTILKSRAGNPECICLASNLTHGIGNNENQNKPPNNNDSMPHFLFPSQKNNELKKLAEAAGNE